MTKSKSGERREMHWDASYERRENFLFWPNEEVVRFVSRYFRKRVGLAEYRDVRPFTPQPRSLDLGCGIGRHSVFLAEVGFESHGIELSEPAVSVARNWMSGAGQPPENIKKGSADSLPWPDNYFECAVSHAVLDSMPFALALKAVRELQRVVSPGGLVYIDLIAAVNGGTPAEVTVPSHHERGTVQSYFDASKIDKLTTESGLAVRECTLITKEPITGQPTTARYHLVLEHG